MPFLELNYLPKCFFRVKFFGKFGFAVIKTKKADIQKTDKDFLTRGQLSADKKKLLTGFELLALIFIGRCVPSSTHARINV